VGASIVDPFCGTNLISVYSIAEVVVWFGFIGSYQTIDRQQLVFILSCKLLMNIYPREYNKFEIWVVIHNLCYFLYANERIV
jgi:hypothetical protein